MIVYFAAAFLFSIAASLAVNRKFTLEFAVRAILYFVVISTIIFSGKIFKKTEKIKIFPVLFVDARNKDLFFEYSDSLIKAFGEDRIFFFGEDTFLSFAEFKQETDFSGVITPKSLFVYSKAEGIFRGKIFVLADKFPLDAFSSDVALSAESLVFLLKTEKRTFLSVTGGTERILPGDTVSAVVTLSNAGPFCSETVYVSIDGILTDSIMTELLPLSSKSFVYTVYERAKGNHRMVFATSMDSDYFDYSAGEDAVQAVIYASEPDPAIATARRLIAGNSRVNLSVYTEGLGEGSLVFEDGLERAVKTEFEPQKYSLVLWISGENPFESRYNWRNGSVVFWLVKERQTPGGATPETIYLTDIGKKHELTERLGLSGVTADQSINHGSGKTILIESGKGAIFSVESRKGCFLLTMPSQCLVKWYFDGGEARDFAKKFLEAVVVWTQSRQFESLRISLPKKGFFTDEAVYFWIDSPETPEVKVDGREISPAGKDGETHHYFLTGVGEGTHLIEAGVFDLVDSAVFTVEERFMPESLAVRLNNASVLDLDSFTNSLRHTETESVQKIFIHDFFPVAMLICAAAIFAWFLAERKIRR